MTKTDDQRLLERAQSSAAGFGELFDAYYDRIYAYAYRRVGVAAAAEDIAASVFEDALVSLKNMRWQGKPVVVWLYRIAARRVADHYRAGRHETLDDRDAGGTDGGLELVETTDEYAAVRRGMDKLSESDRDIIRMAFFDELSGAEIAAILHCSPNTSYVRLHRALKRLESMLRAEEREMA
ncbi:MAG: sigma-70 family RNA polymerase sigma factor [Chloroflexi bacterium]|nr:sigma-70 family RNA polymerase sigma factor [Chloroflexota bacterium]